MAQTEQLSASLEDYLEAIFNIISDNGGVRAKDIADTLGVKAGSVTTALQALKKNGHINYKPYGRITLTPKGHELAEKVARKHEALKVFFVDILGAEIHEAESGACKIEHVITDRLLGRLIAFAEFVKACPHCGGDIVRKFHLCHTSLNAGKAESFAGVSVDRPTNRQNFLPKKLASANYVKR